MYINHPDLGVIEVGTRKKEKYPDVTANVSGNTDFNQPLRSKLTNLQNLSQ